MGNAASSHTDATAVVGLKETQEDHLSVTNNSATSSSDSSSSSAISAEDDFYDCPQYPLEDPPISNNVKSSGSSINNQTRRQDAMDTPTIANKSSSASMDECFRLPFFFRKQPNLIRVLHQDESNDDDDDDDDNVMLQSGEQNQQPNTCWHTGTRQRQQRKSSLSTRGDETESNFEDSLEFDNNGQDEDLSSDDEDYSCSPAYLYRKSKTAATTTGTTSAVDSSKRRFYYCYPSASTGGSITASASSSSLSKCKSAMTSSASGLSPLFLDETRSSDWEYTQEELDMPDGDEPTEASDMKPPRKYWIVTTAALPWMTGTAVNPLLRAAYLSQRNRRLMQQQQKQAIQESEDTPASSTATTSSTVTLVLPWLEYPEDREKLYGTKWAAHDKTCADQEAYIREWLGTSAHLPLEAADPSEGGIAIQWYPARYHASLSSIFALGDLCEMIPTDNDNDDTDSIMSANKRKKSDMICILEEPEHVNFYRAPGRESWRDHFGHVIGVVHTNYKAYARNHYSGIVTGPLVGALSSLMVRAYCDKVVKLSPVLQTYAPGKEVISNVHGIRQEFFRVPMPSSRPKVQCYFIGKLLWAKGLDKLLDLEARYRKTTGQYFGIDVIGSGPEQTEIERSFLGRQQNRSLDQTSTSSTSHWRYFRQPIPARFLGRKDHAAIGSQYAIFVNPSITEVLCTTTAEAIAMGKWVIIPRHASNEFFLQFPNCLQYKHKGEFVELFQYAMANPVSQVIQGSHNNNGKGLDDRSHLYSALTWEAATERLIDTAYLSKRDERRRDRLTLHKEDKSIQAWHYTLGNGKSGDVLRKVFGGGPVAEQSTYKKLSPSSSSSTLSASASTRSLISAI